jgi:hypothetical protein
MNTWEYMCEHVYLWTYHGSLITLKDSLHPFARVKIESVGIGRSNYEYHHHHQGKSFISKAAAENAQTLPITQACNRDEQ